MAFSHPCVETVAHSKMVLPLGHPKEGVFCVSDTVTTDCAGPDFVVVVLSWSVIPNVVSCFICFGLFKVVVSIFLFFYFF